MYIIKHKLLIISEETEEQIEDTNELLEEAQLELENILENMEEVRPDN